MNQGSNYVHVPRADAKVMLVALIMLSEESDGDEILSNALKRRLSADDWLFTRDYAITVENVIRAYRFWLAPEAPGDVSVPHLYVTIAETAKQILEKWVWVENRDWLPLARFKEALAGEEEIPVETRAYVQKLGVKL